MALKLALVGCGRISQLVHLDALGRLRGARLVALAEVDPTRLTEAGLRVPDATRFTDYRDLIAGSDADAVVITLPPAMHAEAAVAAFQAGKHVYLEKPLAIAIEEAQAILRAAARSRKVGMVGFNYRFHPLYRALREQIQAHRVGQPIGVRSVFCGAARALPPWKTARSTGGGALLDLASHHIDLIRFLLGQEITEVSAQVRSVRTEDDTATLQMRLADGVLVQTLVSMNAAEIDRIEILGDAGELVADRYRETHLTFTPQKRRLEGSQRILDGVRRLAATPLQVLAQLRPPREDSHREALQAFVDAVRNSGPTPIALTEGFRSLSVVLAAEASARSGRTEPVPGFTKLQKEGVDAVVAHAREANTTNAIVETGTATALHQSRTVLHPQGAGPDMSVVLVTPDRFHTIRRTVRFLRAQTVQSRLELILVGPTAQGLDDHNPSEVEGFFGVQKVASGPIRNVDRAATHGIHSAQAPVVALVEDHAFPEPAWAESLLRAHQGPWAAVGSVVLNANPDSALSWTNLLIAYGTWTEPVQVGETDHVSQHNISFKLAVLKEFGDNLEEYMGRNGGLLQRMRARGHRFYLESEARIYHANPSLLSSTVELRFHAGRLAAAARSSGWSPAKRALYVIASPVFPLLRARALRGKIAAIGIGWRSYAALALGLMLDSAGQALGFAMGPGCTAQKLADFEFDRLRHVTPSDRDLLRS